MGVGISLLIASSIIVESEEMSFQVDRSSDRNISTCNHTIKHLKR